jgi:PAS domain S-box-containing protein
MSFLTAVAAYAFGSRVYNTDRRNPVNVMFFVFAAVTAILGFMEFMMRQSETAERAGVWSLYVSLLPVLNATFFNFVLIYTGSMKKHAAIKAVSLYLPVLIYFAYIFSTGNAVHDVEKKFFGYAFSGIKRDPGAAVSVILAVLYSFASVVFLLTRYFSADDRKDKRDAMYILSAVGIPIAIGMLEALILRPRGVILPNLTSMGSLAMVIIIAFAVFRFQVFDISTETAARGLISIMQNFFILADRDFRVVRMSGSLCAALKRGEEYYKDKKVEGMIYPDSPNKWSDLSEALKSGEALENREVSFMGPEGLQIPAILSAMPVKTSGAEISGYLISAVDISERKKLEEELFKLVNEVGENNRELAESKEEIKGNYEKLKELDLMKQNFISIVSHELRTPLTSIKGFLSFLTTGMAGPVTEKQRDFLSTISGNTEKLLKLINELLDFSKIESGTFSVSKRPSDAALLADKVLEEMASIAMMRRLSLRKQYTNTGKMMELDEQRISQVLINLINNSMKFSRPDTDVSLFIDTAAAATVKLPLFIERGTLKNEKYMLFHVKDEGAGMEQKYADRIFEKFYQIEDPNIRRHEGIGLGLNIAKSIVEAHDGFIWAESEGKDKGADFYFALPV